MKKIYKYKDIKKFDEDILGFFSRQNRYTWNISKTSKYLKQVLIKNPNYRKLLYKRRGKILFFKKKRFLRFKTEKWLRWRQRFNWLVWKKNHLSVGSNIKDKNLANKASVIRIVKGWNFLYHLSNVFKKKTEKNLFLQKKTKQSLKNEISFLRMKLRKFYGFKTLKFFSNLLYSNRYYTKILGYSYVYLLEGRLEVALYRSNFFISILSARQAILHSKILVNGIVIINPNYNLNLGDIITLNISWLARKQLYKNLVEKAKRSEKKIGFFLFVNYPAYLEVNYKLGSIIFIKYPSVSEVPYPFLLNLNLMKHKSIK